MHRSRSGWCMVYYRSPSFSRPAQRVDKCTPIRQNSDMKHESGYLSRVRGSLGEALAVCHVLGRGMTVLGRNVRLGKDEIDIVAFDPLDRCVAFVEVKMRTNGEFYHPSLNMTRVKRKHMIRAARRWVHAHGYDGGYRLDAAYVSDSRVEYVVDLDVQE